MPDDRECLQEAPRPEDHKPHELFWIDHQQFLLSRGYLLRPRYRPGWVPGWKQPGADSTNYRDHEDSIVEQRPNILDAVRVADGSTVVLKRVRTYTAEIGLGLYFNSDELVKDPHNRTYRLLDVIPLSDDDTFAIIVMPLLRLFHTPIFRAVEEITDAMRQFLQGLEFMHRHNVAHRDACMYNLMMDATNVIPYGFHFSMPCTEAGVGYGVNWRARSSVAPVDYYFIDFGLADYLPEGPEHATDTGVFGQDKTVPELSATIPYNPFKVDIYQLGNVFKDLSAKYPDIAERFEPLVYSMTRFDPEDRPTASEALAEFEAICLSMPPGEMTKKLYLRPRSPSGRPVSGESDSDYELASESESGSLKEDVDQSGEQGDTFQDIESLET
ncbi:kinase-like domain-containing protein [Mycena galericulata]|nr:kinase-like domain-containing protein [Mycena galericulata]